MSKGVKRERTEEDQKGKRKKEGWKHKKVRATVAELVPPRAIRVCARKGKWRDSVEHGQLDGKNSKSEHVEELARWKSRSKLRRRGTGLKWKMAKGKSWAISSCGSSGRRSNWAHVEIMGMFPRRSTGLEWKTVSHRATGHKRKTMGNTTSQRHETYVDGVPQSDWTEAEIIGNIAHADPLSSSGKRCRSEQLGSSGNFGQHAPVAETAKLGTNVGSTRLPNRQNPAGRLLGFFALTCFSQIRDSHPKIGEITGVAQKRSVGLKKKKDHGTTKTREEASRGNVDEKRVITALSYKATRVPAHTDRAIWNLLHFFCDGTSCGVCGQQARSSKMYTGRKE